MSERVCARDISVARFNFSLVSVLAAEYQFWFQFCEVTGRLFSHFVLLIIGINWTVNRLASVSSWG
jgi:hypothetical protein